MAEPMSVANGHPPCVRLQRKGELATLTLNRPERYNSLPQARLASREASTRALAMGIASKPAAALRAGRRLLQRQLELAPGDAYAMGAESTVCNPADARDGIDAFLEKRSLRWSG